MTASVLQVEKRHIRRLINVIRYGLSGAIGGLAFINTFAQIRGTMVSDSVEGIAMAIGAATVVAVFKALNIA